MITLEEYVEREKPQTQKSMVESLWQAVVGMNGDGILARVERIERKVDEHQTWHGQAASSRKLAIAGWVVAGLVTIGAALMAIL